MLTQAPIEMIATIGLPRSRVSRAFIGGVAMLIQRVALACASRSCIAVALLVVFAPSHVRRLEAQEDPSEPSQVTQEGTPSSQVLPDAPSPAAATTSPRMPPSQTDRGHIPFKRLADIDLNIQPSGKLLPEDVAVPFFNQASTDADAASRNWAIKEFVWEAPGLCYRPLYFEEVGLERHGYSFGCLQPAVSSAQFFGRSLALPVLMAVQPPGECIYPLGHDRPGESVPFYIDGPLRRR